jgi:hypothetical protein
MDMMAMGGPAAAGLAAEGEGTTWIGPFLVGVAVVALLIGMVIWRRGRARPPHLDEQPPAARTRGSGAPRAPDDFGAEGERLSPHELRGYGNQGRAPGKGPEGPARPDR